MLDVIVIDRAAFNQGKNALYPPHIERTQVMDTLIARGPHAVSYAIQMESQSLAHCAQEIGKALAPNT